MALTFSENFKAQFAVESVVAAISVKSFLSRDELFDSLGNIASIPQPSAEVVQPGLLGKPFLDYQTCMPSSFVFAFDGMSLETCLKHVRDYYKANPTPINRIPRSIIVNAKYGIRCLPYKDGKIFAWDSAFDESRLEGVECSEDTEGFPIFWMLTELTKGVTWLDGTVINFEPYFEEAYPSESEQ